MIYKDKTINRITLTPNQMATIEYSGHWVGVDILNHGPGDIYVNWTGDAVIGDENSLLLKEAWGYSVKTNRFSFNNLPIKLNIISDNASVVQVVRTVM